MVTEIMRADESFKGIQGNWIILMNRKGEVRLIKIEELICSSDVRLSTKIELKYQKTEDSSDTN